MSKFRVGDKVRVLERESHPTTGVYDIKGGEIGYISEVNPTYYIVHSEENGQDGSYNGDYYGFFVDKELEPYEAPEPSEPIVEDVRRSASMADVKQIQYSTNEVKKENVMTTVVKKIKDLTLSADDRLLREYGLVQDDGRTATEDGIEVLQQLLFDERKSDLVTKVKALKAQEKADKK